MTDIPYQRFIPSPLLGPVTVVVTAVKRFIDDDGVGLSAALAFYALFSFAPLLMLAARAVELLLGAHAVDGLILEVVGDLAGAAAAEQATEVMKGIEQAQGGWVSSMWSLGLLLVGATTVVAQLQGALNRIWGTEGSDKNVVVNFLVKRGLSLLLVASFGALTFGSLLVSSVISALGDPNGPVWMQAIYVLNNELSAFIDAGVSWALFSLFFTLLFRFVPDTHVRWIPAIRGAMVTSGLFVTGKQAISWYLGTTAIGSMYGAAGSLAVVLAWTFYSSIIVLFGAELTLSWCAWRNESATDEEEQALAEDASRTTATA